MVDDEKISKPDNSHGLQAVVQRARNHLKLICHSVLINDGDLFATESQKLIPFLRYSDARIIFVENLGDEEVTDLSLAAIQFAKSSYLTQVIQIEDESGVSEQAFRVDEERQEFCQRLAIYLEKLLERFRTNPDKSEFELARALKDYWRGNTISDFPTMLDDMDPGLFPATTRWELVEISLATLGLSPFQRSYIEELIKATPSL